MTRLRDHSGKNCRSNVGALLPPLEFGMRGLRHAPAREGTYYGRIWDERAVNWLSACPNTPSKEVVQ